MKKMIIAAMMLLGTSAFADTTLLNCAVPESTSVTLTVDLADDQSIDFVLVYLNENAGQSVFFSQMEKGSAAAQIQNGFLNILALTDKTAQEDGVIKNTGFLGLNKDTATTFSGFLAANGNIYPLTCTK